jgi:mannose-6-phosphate isomerase-like protein (cupin superfamily)
MKLLTGALGFFVLAISVGAQTPAPSPPPSTQARRPAVRPKPGPVQVTVRDQSGAPIAYAHVTVSGAVSRAVLTNADGVATLQAMPEGTFRLRFESEGFVTLERDLTVRTGQPHDLEVELTPAPAPPAAPQPEPPPPPSPAPPAVGPSGPPVTLSIPAFLDKNFIGRDPLKESVLGCTGSSTTRLLQLRDPIALHSHDLDEIIYVVAGDGAVRTRPPGEPRDESIVVGAGSLSVIPRGVPHAIERRGRNPLIILSTLAGAPCQAATATHQATKQ